MILNDDGQITVTPTQLALTNTLGYLLAEATKDHALAYPEEDPEDHLVACVLALACVLPAVCKMAGVTPSEAVTVAYWTVGAGRMQSGSVH